MTNVPYQQAPDGFIEYSIFSVAFYLSDFFATIIRNIDSNDFWEMLVHHIVTLCLYAGMLHSNHLRVGVLVSALHSASDVLLCLSRGLSQIETKLTPIVFLCNMFVWVYCRNYAFVELAYITFTNPLYDADKPELKWMF